MLAKSKIIKLVTLGVIALVSTGCSCKKDACHNVDAATAAIVPGSAADFEKNVPHNVYFAFDSAKIAKAAEANLATVANFLVTYDKKVVIEGHADERGTREYNIALGQKRADAVKKHLVKLGVKAENIDIISYGKDKPVVEGNTEEAHAQNRVAIAVLTA